MWSGPMAASDATIGVIAEIAATDAADVAASVATTKRQGVAAIARNHQRSRRRRPKTTSRRGKPVAWDAVPGRATSDAQTSPPARESMGGAADYFITACAEKRRAVLAQDAVA